MSGEFEVFATYKSPIGGHPMRYQLVKSGVGFIFRNVETGTFVAGTYATADRKFSALESFAAIFREFSPAFELK